MPLEQSQCHTPHIGVVAFLPEACADGCTLLLDDGALVGNGLRSAHVPNELLHYNCLAHVESWGRDAWRTRSHCGGL